MQNAYFIRGLFHSIDTYIWVLSLVSFPVLKTELQSSFSFVIQSFYHI